MHKTQVFIRPDSEHIRTRLTHTLEVMQIARTIARAIKANEDLVECISLGHDLGHTPFGHIGEEALNEKLRDYGLFFKHYIQSYRIVNYLEKYYKFPQGGINLTYAVKFGIVRHSGTFSNDKEEVKIYDKEGEIKTIKFRQTIEEQIVRIADDIAWLNHDWEDGIRSGLLTNSLLGENLLLNLGQSHAERINKMVIDVIENFYQTGKIEFSTGIEKLKGNLKEKIAKYLWNNEIIKRYNEEAKRIIQCLFDFFIENPSKLPDDTKKNRNLDDYKNEKKLAIVISDYLSGMTDHWCLRNYETYIYGPFNIYTNLKFPKDFTWIKIEELNDKKYCKISLPENLNLDKGSKFKILKKDIYNEDKKILEISEINLSKYEIGECEYRGGNCIEITNILNDKELNKDDILLII